MAVFDPAAFARRRLSSGVDQVALEEFNKDLTNNLYNI
jgi:hypothetical protein